MNTKKIVFLDSNTLPNSVNLKEIKLPHELTCFPYTKSDEINSRVKDANIIITNKVKISEEVIAGARNLELIAIAATGTDIIDLVACEERNIAVKNVTNYATNTVPEHTFALMLNLRRNINAYYQSVRRGQWMESNQFCFFDYKIKDLSGSTLGIIGNGVLGKRVAEIAKCFGMNVLIAAHKGIGNMDPLYTDFDEVIRTSDIITLHCPLRESTRNMIAEREFKMMKPEALLINTARGGIVNESDLYHAIMKGEIAGAAFDVAVNEPPQNNEAIMKLTEFHNFILTPHISWASAEAIQTLADLMIDNINTFYN